MRPLATSVSVGGRSIGVAHMRRPVRNQIWAAVGGAESAVSPPRGFWGIVDGGTGRAPSTIETAIFQATGLAVVRPVSRCISGIRLMGISGAVVLAHSGAFHRHGIVPWCRPPQRANEVPRG